MHMSNKKAAVRGEMTRAQWTWNEMKKNKVAYFFRPPFEPIPDFFIAQSASRMEAFNDCVMIVRLPSVRSTQSL